MAKLRKKIKKKTKDSKKRSMKSKSSDTAFKIENKKRIEALNKQVGAWIKFYRNLRKMSRKALGKKVRNCYQQIQNYETGKNQLTLNKLVALAEALDVPFLKLLPSDLLLTTKSE